ncbi:condensation domain-containing protein, partial [Rheinheimera gaetbuli]
PLQEGILFHHMMSTKGDPYVMPVLFRVKNKEAFEAFVDALQFVIGRHDVLRTAVLWDGVSVPVQVVYRQAELPVTWLSAPKDTDVESHMQSLCAPEIQQMDVTQGPLLKLQVMADTASEQHFVLAQLHHLISDHIGLEVIQHEVGMYEQGQVEQLTTPVPYREFIAHTQHQARVNDAEAYFRGVLEDVTEATAPFNLMDIQGDGSRIVEVREIIPTDVSMQLRQVAKSLKVSPAALFHSAWAILVGACSGRDDVVFGTVVSGRLQGTVGAESMMGVFMNTLPLRVKLKRLSVLQLVQQVQSALLDLIPFEQASLALAQQCTSLPKEAPIFSAMLNYRHSVGEATGAEAQQTSDYEVIGGHERSNFPLSLLVDDLKTDFVVTVQVESVVNACQVIGYVQSVVAALAEKLSTCPDTEVTLLAKAPQAGYEQYMAASDYFGTMLESAPVQQVPYKVDAALGQERAFSHHAVKISELVVGLNQRADELQVCLSSVLLAIHFKILSLLSGETEAVSCIAFDSVYGEKEQGFTAALPMCMETPVGSWRELIQYVSGCIETSKPFRFLPLAEIQKQSGRDFSEVLFHFSSLLTDDFPCEFDLCMDVSGALGSNTLQLTIHYNRHLYDAEQIAEIGGYYER